MLIILAVLAVGALTALAVVPMASAAEPQDQETIQDFRSIDSDGDEVEDYRDCYPFDPYYVTC